VVGEGYLAYVIPAEAVAESGDLRGLCGMRSRNGYAVRDDSELLR